MSEPVRRQRKPAEQRRREIVDAVLDLAYERGPDNITADAIAERIGFAQPAVFRHFPTMADIWLAVADTVGERVRAQWDAADHLGRSAHERLRAVLHAHLGVIQANPGLPSILFSRELQARNDALQARFRQHLDGFAARLERMLRDGAAAGELAADLDPSRAAYSILALLQGVAFRWALTQRSFDLQTEGLAAFEVLWSGLRAG